VRRSRIARPVSVDSTGIERMSRATLSKAEPPRTRTHMPILTQHHDRHLLAREQAPAAVEDLVEHGRGIRDRAADHLQHFAGGSLALERFARFVEKAHVLDGDHGLVGEGLQQLDLVGREGARLAARDGDRPDGLALAHHGHDHLGTKAALAREFAPFVIVRGVGLGVLDDRGLQREDGREHGGAGKA